MIMPPKADANMGVEEYGIYPRIYHGSGPLRSAGIRLAGLDPLDHVALRRGLLQSDVSDIYGHHASLAKVHSQCCRHNDGRILHRLSGKSPSPLACMGLLAMPCNILGQICPQFLLLWLALSLPALWLCARLRQILQMLL